MEEEIIVNERPHWHTYRTPLLFAVMLATGLVIVVTFIVLQKPNILIDIEEEAPLDIGELTSEKRIEIIRQLEEADVAEREFGIDVTTEERSAILEALYEADSQEAEEAAGAVLTREERQAVLSNFESESEE